MTDTEFLKAICSAVVFLAKAMPRQMITIKGADSGHLFCSDYLAELVGVKAEQLMGHKVWPAIYDHNPDIETIIREEDQAVILARKPKVIFKINRFTTGLMPYFACKAPLINPKTDQVVGVLFQGFEMGALTLNQHVMDAVSSMSQTHKTQGACPRLSKREKQVVFFFMMHLGSQEIAEMLHQLEGKIIAKSTIDSVFIDQLYIKFDVHSRPALYKKLQQFGFGKMVPEGLLKSASTILDTICVY